MGLVLSWLGCSTSPLTSKHLSLEEVAQRDRAIGVELAQQFESHLKFKQDTEVSIYLRKLAQLLADHSGDVDGTSVGVWLIRQEKWHCYSLPGNRIYLPVGMLKKLEFENELAALMAIEFGHIQNKQLLKHLTRELEPNEKSKMTPSNLDGLFIGGISPPVDKMHFFGPSSIFTFTEEENLSAARSAVNILYHAGYDARGLITVLSLFQKNVESSPYEELTLNRMIDVVRKEIAMFAPLRNPIVRSQGFMKIQKRIQRL